MQPDDALPTDRQVAYWISQTRAQLIRQEFSKRGKINEPSYIIHTIEKLSQIKKLPIEAVMKYTTNNFKNLFNLN